MNMSLNAKTEEIPIDCPKNAARYINKVLTSKKAPEYVTASYLSPVLKTTYVTLLYIVDNDTKVNIEGFPTHVNFECAIDINTHLRVKYTYTFKDQLLINYINHKYNPYYQPIPKHNLDDLIPLQG